MGISETYHKIIHTPEWTLRAAEVISAMVNAGELIIFSRMKIYIHGQIYFQEQSWQFAGTESTLLVIDKCSFRCGYLFQVPLRVSIIACLLFKDIFSHQVVMCFTSIIFLNISSVWFLDIGASLKCKVFTCNLRVLSGTSKT